MSLARGREETFFRLEAAAAEDTPIVQAERREAGPRIVCEQNASVDCTEQIVAGLGSTWDPILSLILAYYSAEAQWSSVEKISEWVRQQHDTL